MTIRSLLLVVLLVAPASAETVMLTRHADPTSVPSCGSVFEDGAHAFVKEPGGWVDLDARNWAVGWPVYYERTGADELGASERFRLGDGGIRVEIELAPTAGTFLARLLPDPKGDFELARRQYLPGIPLPCEVRGELSTTDRLAKSGELTPENARAVYQLEHEATELLYDEAFAEAAGRLARAQALSPQSDQVRWMRARVAFLRGESLAETDTSERLAAFAQAERYADEAVTLAPNHGEGWLWRAIARGRIVTTKATARVALDALLGARGPGFVSESFERALDLAPVYSYFGFTARGDAMNGAAQLYRMLPAGGLVGMVLGVERDLDRSVELALDALRLQPVRLEYAKEAGVALLCRGVEQHDKKDLEQGHEVLVEALELPVRTETERTDHRHVQELLAARPDRACGYSRDAWGAGRVIREAGW